MPRFLVNAAVMHLHPAPVAAAPGDLQRHHAAPRRAHRSLANGLNKNDGSNFKDFSAGYFSMR